MSVMYPLAIVNTASITSLVRMTLYQHPLSVYHTKVEMNEGMAALGEKAQSAAVENTATRLMSDIPGVLSVKNQMAMPGEPMAS
jgi:osmotically-inducible protein OsmY